ncbi:MAG TPA: hypothetical protein PLA68_04280 [Panacibacter sp.]|nr:hypothetical protein [Panacibacter sp.]
MQVNNKTQTVYNFKNTCYRCFNDIEIPLLGDFAYGELIFQTKDGQDYFVAILIDNAIFDFIVETLTNDEELKHKKVDPQKILTLLADKINGIGFTTDYPICPICKRRQNHFNDNIRTTERELHFATWNDFENLTHDNKIKQIKEVFHRMK